MKSALNSFSNLGTKVLLYPVSFLASIWIARYLGPEEKGIYAYIVVLSSFFIPIFSLGLGGGFIFFTSNKKYRPEDVGLTVFLSGLVIGFINALLVFVFWKFNLLGEVGEKITSHQIVFVCLILIFNAFYFFIGRMAVGVSRFNTINGLEILKSIMNPVVMILLVYLFALRIDGVLYGLLLLNMVLGLGIIYKMYRSYKPVLVFRKDFLKDSFFYGLKGWLGDMAVRANVRLDQIILGGIISAKSLGFYSISVTLTELLWIIPDSIGPVLFNRIAAEKDAETKLLLMEKIHRILFYLTLLIAVFWVLTCVYIVIPYGYGNEFQSSLVPLLILVPGAIIYISAKVTTKLLSGSGRILETSKATALGSGVSILLYIFLIPKYGVIGAALASTIGYCFVSLFCIYYSAKYFNTSLSGLFLLNKSDFAWLKEQYYSLKALARKKIKP